MGRPAAAGAGVTDLTTERHKQLALVLLAMTQFVVVIDASIVNVALPTIGRQLHARRKRCCAASRDPSPVRHSTSTTDGTTGGHRPSRRNAAISAAARPERSARPVTAPESNTSISTYPAQLARARRAAIRRAIASARACSCGEGSPKAGSSWRDAERARCLWDALPSAASDGECGAGARQPGSRARAAAS